MPAAAPLPRAACAEVCCPDTVCCDDPSCAPKDPRGHRRGDTRAGRKGAARAARPRRAAVHKSLLALCLCVGVAACALRALPGAHAHGSHGALRPGFVTCDTREDGTEHCEEDKQALELHCSEVTEDEYNLNLHIANVFIQIAVSFSGCLIPILSRRFSFLRVSEFVWSMFKHFGAGIILATGFIHVFAPAYGNLSSICLSDFWLEYGSWAGAFAMIAVLFTQLIQTLAVSYLKAFHQHQHGPLSATAADMSRQQDASIAKETSPIGDNSSVILEANTDMGRDFTSGCHAGANLNAQGPDIGKLAGELVELQEATHTHHLLLAHRQRRQITVYVLEIGIATHSFIIGMAAGVSSGPELTALVIALAFHQFIEGIALSATVLDAGFKTNFQPIFMVMFFTLTTPLGIATGIAIHSVFVPNSETTLLTLGIIDAIAAGILIYDSCVNLLAANMTNSAYFMRLSWQRKAVSFLALWSAAAIMSVIGIWA
ncbi:ZIP zinc transporter-domain-containing protein [Hyaloraphidium curvatum]|nr:ZIP zinc transporter-domain-containing protein [Hyaloraphidium curvatum]